ANSGGNATFGISITVNDIAPSGLSYNSPNVFTKGSAISALNPTVSGSVLNYSVSPALPAGLSLNPTTGEISGTPTAVTSTAVYTVTASNSGGNTTFGISITVNDVAPSGLSYNSPNVFTAGPNISPLLPAVTGNVMQYSVSPDLPAGLSIDSFTGIISGTPLFATEQAVYMVTATNSGGSVSFGIVITVNPAAPSGLSYTTPNIFVIGTTIGSLTPSVTGEGLIFSIQPTLPLGLAFDTGSGVISGTPGAVSPETTYLVRADNASGSTSFNIVISVIDTAPTVLSYPSPNTLTAGVEISPLSPTTTGNNLVYTISPDLPSGLVFDAATGMISGTPTAITPTATYTVTATNSGGSISFDVVISVIDAAAIALSYPSPNTLTAGVEISPLSPTTTGNNLVYTISPDLPSGLVFDAATGVISGTPTAITPTATYTVTATNSGGSISFDIVISVIDAAPVALSYPSPNTLTAGVEISPLSPTTTGNNLVYTISPDLPSGLVFDAATGVISGTPTAITPTATYTVTATNSGGSISFDIVISVIDAVPTSLSYPSPNIFVTGIEISPLQPSVSGANISYSVSPDLPPGLVFDTATGIISGTPTVATEMGTYTVTATNSGGSVSFDVIITVNEELGVHQDPRFDFSVWPNPFSDTVNVAAASGELSYRLFSVDGRLIGQGTINGSQIRFNNLPDGVYLLQLEQNGRSAMKKLIKKD
ncbi:MAG: T9SS type A sorting domain-containing protein, partial [Flavobacterium sp.]